MMPNEERKNVRTGDLVATWVCVLLTALTFLIRGRDEDPARHPLFVFLASVLVLGQAAITLPLLRSRTKRAPSAGSRYLKRFCIGVRWFCVLAFVTSIAFEAIRGTWFGGSWTAPAITGGILGVGWVVCRVLEQKLEPKAGS
jgi:hypothetical protein